MNVEVPVSQKPYSFVVPPNSIAPPNPTEPHSITHLQMHEYDHQSNSPNNPLIPTTPEPPQPQHHFPCNHRSSSSTPLYSTLLQSIPTCTPSPSQSRSIPASLVFSKRHSHRNNAATFCLSTFPKRISKSMQIL